jgi:hypothetical protein
VDRCCKGFELPKEELFETYFHNLRLIKRIAVSPALARYLKVAEVEGVGSRKDT